MVTVAESEVILQSRAHLHESLCSFTDDRVLAPTTQFRAPALGGTSARCVHTAFGWLQYLNTSKLL